MTKLFISHFVIIFFFLPCQILIAQIPKLNNAFNASSGIVVDSKGNAFVTGNNNKIIRISPEGKASLFAGSLAGFVGTKDGPAKDARFNGTEGIAIDQQDNLYIADNNRIRKITPDAMVSTVAGLITTAESRDGDRNIAAFLHLENITIDFSGNIYVTDFAPDKDWRPGQVRNSSYYYIRKITPGGTVTTLQNTNSGPLILQYPRGLVCDKAGNLFISALASHCIKKIEPSGVITTVAGQCDKTILNSVYKEGAVSGAVLTSPSGIALAPNGDIYFSDERMNRIIKIANNKVTTVAGCGKISFSGNPAGASEAGETDGKSSVAMFDIPSGIAFDRGGNLYIVDRSGRNNSYIRKLSTTGMVTTFCKHYWNPTTSQYEEAD